MNTRKLIDRIVIWFGSAIAAVAGAIILSQLNYGWFGWLTNFILIVCVMIGAFLAGWLEAE